MTLKLYKLDMSPAARAVMMLCDIYDIPVERIEVNLLEGEHKTPEFLKINPLHTVPVLQDGDVILQDSHAILIHLAQKYGKGDVLYPKDETKRVLIIQKLFFDATVAYQRLRNISYEALVEGDRRVTERKLRDVTETYGFFEEYLMKNKFIAGDQMTIADLSTATTAQALDSILTICPDKYPKLTSWLKWMKSQIIFKKYEKAANDLKELYQKNLEY